MYEHRSRPLLPRREFYRRMAWHTLTGSCLVALSLGLGMWGYHDLENLGWTDAFVNAAMILSGMGPVSELHTGKGKIFAGCYALFSGLAFIILIGVILAPAIHRFLHKFHLEEQSPVKKKKHGSPQDS